MRRPHLLLPILLALAAPASAQEDPDLAQLASSAFVLEIPHIAVSGVRSSGYTTGCVTSAPVAQYFQFGCASPLYHQAPTASPDSTRMVGQFFDLGLLLAAPPSDFPDVTGMAPLGGGWTVATNSRIAEPSGGADKIRPVPGSSPGGALSTEDGRCTDFTEARDGFIRVGHPLLPVSGCPPTYGPAGWAGRDGLGADALQINAAYLSGDPFATWRLPVDTPGIRGDWHTHGVARDHTPELLELYGGVTPQRSGTPQYAGWPLGIEVRFDAFQHHLEPAARAWYWDGLLINRSEEVWGTAQAYDSVYIGLYFSVINGLEPHYFDPGRSSLLFNAGGDGCVGHPTPPGIVCRESSRGWNFGGWAIAVLRSPVGDMRNKLLSDPASPFHQPGHPDAGDTITFQHERMCGYGGCYSNTAARSQRAFFGLLSSTGGNALDGRRTSDLDAGSYYRIFRPEDWPNRSMRFNAYVPGVHDDRPVWDWNHDGRPDTIHADTCGSRGCVAVFSDTAPGGFAHAYGNVAYLGVGPIRLAPRDTVPLTLAFIGGPDSAGIEAAVNNTIGFYQRFYEGPTPPPAPTLSVLERGAASEVTISVGEEPEQWRDGWLTWFDVQGDLGRNPWLADSLAARAENNVAALHLFLSCDGGRTWGDGHCAPTPAGTSLRWAEHGWLPYRTIQADAQGRLPETVRVPLPVTGRDYAVAAVVESRGATWTLERAGLTGLEVEPITWAPALLSPFPGPGEPGRLDLYVPVGEEPVAGDLSRVHMVPNPFIVRSDYQTGARAAVRFTHLPPEGRLRIYDVAGRFIQEIRWTEGDLVGGDLPFDLLTREGRPMAAGLYMWVLETPEGRRAGGKFVILR